LLYNQIDNYVTSRGQDSSFRYSDSLRAGRSGDRISVEARFSAPVQTGLGAHPVSCTMGTGSFPGVKRPGRGADHPPLSKRRGHERVGLYLYSPSGLSWPVIGRNLPFYVTRRILFHFETVKLLDTSKYTVTFSPQFNFQFQHLRQTYLVFKVP
jgi:hypothetical protein